MDDVEIAKLGPGETVRLEVSAGRHVLSVRSGSASGPQSIVEFAPGAAALWRLRFQDHRDVRPTNVHAGLAVVTALIHRRRHYFGEILGELLFWLGPDRILYGSDYGIWSPKWIVEELMDFELPEDVAAETGQSLTLAVRRKIMGENAARLYNVDIAERCKKLGLQIPAKAEPAAAVA